jgi:two-component system, OmpR family, sensor kinase
MRLILGCLVPCARGLRDVLTVGAPLVLLALIASSHAVLALLPVREITIVLALASMAAGGMGAVLGAAIGRLTGDRRGTWMALGLALYSVAGVPATTIWATGEGGEAALANVRLLAGLAITATLFVSIQPGRVYHRWRCRSVFVVALVAVGVLALLGALFPAESLAISGHPWLRIVTTTVGAIVALAVATTGWVTNCRYRPWVGLGFAAIALAHLDQAQMGPSLVPLGLTSSVVRLFGLLLVALGLSQLALHALVTFDQKRTQQQEELLRANQDLRKAAEQGHELRNGLAGLAGAAGLLVTRRDDGLHAAMASELSRLNALLCTAQDDPLTQQGEYSVVSVLNEQVVLRRSAGMDIRLDTDVRLDALGYASTLSQVVANVLTNCAVHAPGSPVRVQATRHAELILIRVSDFGPGIPTGSEAKVFEPGVRGASSPGHGLGLPICQRLLRADGGTIHIAESRPGGAGCTVRIEIPAVPIEQRTDRVAVFSS